MGRRCSLLLGGLFLTAGLFLGGSAARMLDPTRLGVSLGLWVQVLAVGAATIAGAAATARNYARAGGPRSR